jgi:membrane-associated phospholipid phosphatase
LSFRITPLALAFVMGGGLAVPTRIRAQDPSDSALTAPRPDSLASYVSHAPPAEGNAVHWYVPLAVAGGIGLLSTIDQPVADHFRIHRSSGGQNVADAWSRIGSPVVYGPVTVGVIAGGLIAHDPEVTKAGLRLAFSLALAGIANQSLKAVVGRERPFQSTNAFDFDPIHIDASFPSGHTTMAFAMATSLADDVHPTWAKVGLYGLATGVAVSRVYQQQHWVSDVVGGAALGIASAKFASGRWTIFGIRAPSFLIKGGSPAVGWQFSFHE